MKRSLLCLLIYSLQAQASELACPLNSAHLSGPIQTVLSLAEKVCSAEANLAEFETTSIRPQRLSTKCAQNWEVTTDEGKKISIPAGLRVMRVSTDPQSHIYFYFNGKVIMGTVASNAFTGNSDCSETQESASFHAFLQESSQALNIASDFSKESNSGEFAQEIKSLAIKLEQLKNNPTAEDKFKSLSKKWEEKLPSYEANSVDRSQKAFQHIAAGYDPILSDGKKMSQTTLIVPLTQEWFLSDPELKSFYQKHWLDSGKDIRIQSGASGEGVTYYPDLPQLNESFDEMTELMLKTQAFLQTSSNPKLAQSPEARWLSDQKEKGFYSYKRMIFLSPDTWKNKASHMAWADYVPVDQALGGLPSDYLTSVIIHEINVNSDGYLTTDTHSDYTKNISMWECLKRNGTHFLAPDAFTQQQAFGLNAQISVIYLKMILDEMGD